MKNAQNGNDAVHLYRLASVFIGGFVLLLLLRAFFVPKSFGQYGHFRGDAIQEIAAKPVVYAGHQTCEGCHSDILDVKKDGYNLHN